MGPRTLRLIRAVVIGVCAHVLVAAPAAAQPSRFALDTVAAVDGNEGSQAARSAIAWFDVFGAVRIADGIDLRARPVVQRRAFNGAWQFDMYELALRYERRGPVGLRIDAGQFTSPIGLAILENRPDKNPAISQHSTLYLPIPRVYEPGTPSTTLLAASYPVGLQLTVSGRKWDARAALTDSSPIRGRSLLDEAPRMANVVFGGAITPMIGLRLGGAFARGPFALAEEVRDKTRGDRYATVAQVEGEWSFNYTRIAGEFVWTWRDMAVDEARVDGGWIEVVQTLRPRWFVVGRYDDQWTHWTVQSTGAMREEPYRRFESAVGFRLAPEVTLRAAYLTRKGYVVTFWDDQFLASIVLAKRFW